VLPPILLRRVRFRDNRPAVFPGPMAVGLVAPFQQPQSRPSCSSLLSFSCRRRALQAAEGIPPTLTLARGMEMLVVVHEHGRVWFGVGVGQGMVSREALGRYG